MLKIYSYAMINTCVGKNDLTVSDIADWTMQDVINELNNKNSSELDSTHPAKIQVGNK